jgi:predicted RNase H-like HicB family nuclease
MSEVRIVKPSEGKPVWHGQWQRIDPDTVYECEVVLEAEEDGRFTVYAVRLPGAVSYGNTENEALENITEALKALIASYGAPTEIPWTKPESEMRTGRRRWVRVDCRR